MLVKLLVASNKCDLTVKLVEVFHFPRQASLFDKADKLPVFKVNLVYFLISLGKVCED